VLVVTLAITSAQAAEPRLSMVTAARAPLGPSAEQPGFLQQLAKEAFSRIGYGIEITVLPGERALINVNRGIDDGDLYRAPGFEPDYPNLVQVPESIGTMEFMAYSKSREIHDLSWESLQPFVVAYATGWKIYDRMVKAREVTKVRSIGELFPLLEMGRADLVLLDRWQGSYLARQQGVEVKLLEPPLAKVKMYMYLNKQYQSLVPRLTAALKAMKEDGTYRRIFNTYLKPYQN
jgi:polar amino acid transport system substrate-binding protein